LGIDFYCEDGRQPSKCPIMQGDNNAFSFDDETGEWICVTCGSVIGTDNTIVENEMFDEEEPGVFAPNDDVNFVGEGDKGIAADFSPTKQLEVERLRKYEIILDIANEYDFEFVKKLSEDRLNHHIVARLRQLENAGVKGFGGGRNLPIIPKLLAVMVSEVGYEPEGLIEDKRFNPPWGIKRGNFNKLLEQIERNTNEYKDPTFEIALTNLGHSLDISDDIIKEILEDWETQGLHNQVTDPTAKAAAWLFLSGKKRDLKITKKRLVAIPSVSRAKMNTAIESYQKQLSKLNDPKII